MAAPVLMLSEKTVLSTRASQHFMEHVRGPPIQRNASVRGGGQAPNAWSNAQVSSMVEKSVVQAREPVSSTQASRRPAVAAMMDKSEITVLSNAPKDSVNRCAAKMVSALWTGSDRQSANV